jgi:hypothetical protein
LVRRQKTQHARMYDLIGQVDGMLHHGPCRAKILTVLRVMFRALAHDAALDEHFPLAWSRNGNECDLGSPGGSASVCLIAISWTVTSAVLAKQRRGTEGVSVVVALALAY